MSLLSLHPIELQLVAQFLPVREILSMARLCRFTLDALDSPFAFRCDPLKFATKDFVPGALSPDLRLLRHVEVSLVWSCPDPYGSCWPSDVTDLLAIATKSTGVVALDATQWRAVPADLSERLLFSPCMRELRELRLCPGLVLSPAGMAAVGTLPHLRILHVSISSSDSLGALSLVHLPRLSDLVSQTMGAWGGADQSSIPDSELAAALGSLEQIQAATLEKPPGVNDILDHLHDAPALARVHLLIACDALVDNHSCPAPSVVRALLVAVPALIVSMTIQTTHWPGQDRQRASEWQSRYDDQRAEFGQRLQIELTDN